MQHRLKRKHSPVAWYRVLCVLALLLSSTLPCWALPSFDEVRAQWSSSDMQLLDRHGALIQRIRVDMRARKLDWVSLQATSPALRTTLIASEDQRFYTHRGIDWASVAAAAWGNVWKKQTRGASTLTMQLVGLLDETYKAGKQGRHLWQKMGQAWQAYMLEQHWSKAQILEAYINLVSFRGELVGLSALAMALFDKYPMGLNLEESAIAVALLRAPNASATQVAERACRLLQKMTSAQHSCSPIKARAHAVLNKKNLADSVSPQLAPHFVRKWLTQAQMIPNARWKSTLDAELQRYAIAALKRHLVALATRNVQDGAIIVLDNASGDILAWVGSSGTLSSAAAVDGVTARRQAGSTLKPFLYQLALEQHWLSAASLLDDSPFSLPTASGAYSPQNYESSFKGPVSMRTALAASLNIPAVRTVHLVSPSSLRDRLHSLGLTTLTHDGDFYGFSLALGSADVRLVDLANAYRTLANRGKFSQLRGLSTSPPPATQQKLNAASSFIITDILADRTARALTFGLDSVLTTRRWSAVKTGTSKDMRDNWAVGFTQHHTVAVWVGNASGAPMWDVSGLHGAAPIWQTLIDYLSSRTAPTPLPPPPHGVIRRSIQYTNNIEPTRHEWFLRGTERELFSPASLAHATGPAAIVSPLPHSIYAIDPDIPALQQRILFRADNAANARWWLNGHVIGSGPKVAWDPVPGQHTLQLKNAAGHQLDNVRFQVRTSPYPVRPTVSPQPMLPGKHQ